MIEVAVQPCRSCGGPKPVGQGRKLCDACREVAVEREAERKRQAGRSYYVGNRERHAEQGRAWARAHPEQRRAIGRRYARSDKGYERKLLIKYGLSLGDYNAMLEAQGGVCAICGGTDRRRLNVDHDHVSGEVRGLLCSGCNGAKLGRLGHDLERMEERAEFLEGRARKMRAAVEYLRNPPARRVI